MSKTKTIQIQWKETVLKFCKENKTTPTEITKLWNKSPNTKSIEKCFGKNGDGQMTSQMIARYIGHMKLIDPTFDCQLVATYSKLPKF